METFAQLLATGDIRYLVLAAVSLIAGSTLLALSVRYRPRSRRRAAR